MSNTTIATEETPLTPLEPNFWQILFRFCYVYPKAVMFYSLAALAFIIFLTTMFLVLFLPHISLTVEIALISSFIMGLVLTGIFTLVGIAHSGSASSTPEMIVNNTSKEDNLAMNISDGCWDFFASIPQRMKESWDNAKIEAQRDLSTHLSL